MSRGWPPFLTSCMFSLLALVLRCKCVVAAASCASDNMILQRLDLTSALQDAFRLANDCS